VAHITVCHSGSECLENTQAHNYSNIMYCDYHEVNVNAILAILDLLYQNMLCFQHPVVVFQFQFLLGMDNETHSSLQIVETGEILLSAQQKIRCLFIYMMFILVSSLNSNSDSSYLVVLHNRLFSR